MAINYHAKDSFIKQRDRNVNLRRLVMTPHHRQIYGTFIFFNFSILFRLKGRLDMTLLLIKYFFNLTRLYNYLKNTTLLLQLICQNFYSYIKCNLCNHCNHLSKKKQISFQNTNFKRSDMVKNCYKSGHNFNLNKMDLLKERKDYKWDICIKRQIHEKCVNKIKDNDPFSKFQLLDLIASKE